MQDLREKEAEILKYWKNNGINGKVKASKRGLKSFYFLDGPPYAHDTLMTHHLWVGAFKDAVLRYKRYRGFDVHDRAGFDVHGLPTENKVERKLNLKSKADIEALGIERFVKECRLHVQENIKKAVGVLDRLGSSLDFTDMYIPYENSYMERGWHALSEMHERGLLYKGQKVLAYCPHCETAFSSQGPEIEYADDTDTAIYVAFKAAAAGSALKLDDETYLVVWTTTPWTIPANMAIAVNPDALYVVARSGSRGYIVAKERMATFAAQTGDNLVAVKEFYGRELEGTHYVHMLEGKMPMHKGFYKFHRVITDRSVSLEEGSGLLHVAPGHGAEDYLIGLKNKLSVFSPVDQHSRYTSEAGTFAGLLVPGEANKAILSELRALGSILAEGSVTHSYPHCWRCNSKLIFKATDQWFINVQKMKKRMVKENSKIKWHPREAMEWQAEALASSPDWCISRQRYWGTPVPIWECSSCRHIEVIGSFKELSEKSGLPVLPEDMHRPYVDRIVLKCPKCGAEMRRTADIFDVWYDSGVAHTASLNEEELARLFPADFITESRDQIRGWFTMLLRTSIGVSGKLSFREVVIGGMLLDEIGQEMHRHLGNVITVEDLLGLVSVDGFRLFSLSKPRWSDLNLNRKELKEGDNNIITVYNIAELVKEFASLSGTDLRKASRPPVRGLNPEDRWIISRVNSLTMEITSQMDQYNVDSAVRALRSFVIEDFSRFYLKIAKKRAELAGKRELRSITKVAAYVLKAALVPLSIAAPFTAEGIFQDLFSENGGSIFMEDWPKVKRSFLDRELEGDFEVMKDTVTAILAAREKVNLKLRQPLTSATVKTTDERAIVALEKLSPIIESYTNIKALKIEKVSSALRSVKPVYAKIGPAFKENAPTVAEELAKLDADMLEREVSASGEFSMHTPKGPVAILAEHFSIVESSEAHEGMPFSRGSVYVDANITEALKEELLMRELLRRIQLMRKENLLTKKSRITVYIESDEHVKSVVEKNLETIRAVAKVRRIEFNPAASGLDWKREDVLGYNVKIAIRAVGQ